MKLDPTTWSTSHLSTAFRLVTCTSRSRRSAMQHEAQFTEKQEEFTKDKDGTLGYSSRMDKLRGQQAAENVPV